MTTASAVCKKNGVIIMASRCNDGHGGEDFYQGWMKNKKSAMISCNDGFRPVSFLIETMDEDAQ